jgi:hypothetical protein
MKSLREQIHQLFSEVLIKGQEENLIFEDNCYPRGNGFINLNGINKEFNLSEETGLLGYRHPLHIKTALESSLSSNVFASKKQLIELKEKLQVFFSELLDTQVFISKLSTNNPTAKYAGRFEQFLKSEDLQTLNDRHLNITKCFPVSFAIAKSNSHFNFETISFYDYLLTIRMIRLLKLGQFYCKSKLVKKRSQEINKICNDKSIFNHVDGLTIHLNKSFNLNKIIKKGIIPNQDHTLCLPIFYDIKEVQEAIMLIKDEVCL